MIYSIPFALHNQMLSFMCLFIVMVKSCGNFFTCLISKLIISYYALDFWPWENSRWKMNYIIPNNVSYFNKSLWSFNFLSFCSGFERKSEHIISPKEKKQFNNYWMQLFFFGSANSIFISIPKLSATLKSKKDK